jgi:ribose/xylose/arabinose/galactoside ABC-type transport system permease subunit
MICGEFDLSVGSVFALMPMSVATVHDSQGENGMMCLD